MAIDGSIFKQKCTFVDEYKTVFINMICPFCKNKIKVNGVIERIDNISKRKFSYPTYECRDCSKKYVSIENKADRKETTVDGQTYINLLPEKNSADYVRPMVSKIRKIKEGCFYIYNDFPSRCKNSNCNNLKLSKVNVALTNYKGERCVKSIYQCKECRAYYMHISTYSQIEFNYKIINEYEIQDIKTKYQQQDLTRKPKIVEPNKNEGKKQKKKKELKPLLPLLHPVTNEEIQFTKEQQGCVDYIGDKRKDLVVRSAAGGGKSLVLMQRAMRYLAEAREANQSNAVIIFTYNRVLAEYIKEWMRISPSDKKYIKIDTLHYYLCDVYDCMPGKKLGISAYEGVKTNYLKEILNSYATKSGSDKYQKWGLAFWKEEFAWMRDMNIYERGDWEVYKDLPREGRGHSHPMDSNDRAAAFKMFCMYQDKMRAQRKFNDSFDGDERVLYITHKKSEIPDYLKYQHVLIDEAQDQSLANMIALKSLAKQDVTICMDANQRIYKSRWKFSQWGVNPTSKRLSYPFRCTGQIDALAESLKSHNQADIPEEDRVEHIAPTATGQKPEIICCKNDEQERSYIIALIKKWMEDDPMHNIGIMCYTRDAVDDIEMWLKQDQVDYQRIEADKEFSIRTPGVKLCTIHSSKGLEFMRVILPKFNEGHIPNYMATKDEDIMTNQRNVAYVGMTRAMHQLVITYSKKKSRFITEMDKSLYVTRTYEDAVELDLKEPTPEYQKHIMPEEKEEPEDDGWTF